MTTAYLILAHHKPDMLKRLVRQIQREVYVHVDLKSDITPFLMENPLVHFLKNRVSVDWGGFTTVEATFELLRAALLSDASRFVLLSGVDYPIKPIVFFEEHLSRFPGKCFLSCVDVAEHWIKAEVRYRYTWFPSKLANRFARQLARISRYTLPKIALPKGVRFFGGSQWWVLTREAAIHCLEFAEKNEHLMRIFRRMQLPDEHFFQTVIMNSELQGSIINDNLRFIDFSGAHPRILRANDLEVIVSSAKFFARKFDDAVDSDILDRLDGV